MAARYHSSVAVTVLVPSLHRHCTFTARCRVGTVLLLSRSTECAYDLSFGLSRFQVSPRMVGGDLTGVRVVGVAAGGFRSIALAADGRVFTSRRGVHGRLGHGDVQDQLTPRVVEDSH